ncbi:hypothetical protein MTsDn1_27190 [Alteromonas sp. MTD1]|uniref:hypothetical protein n=1 Tax=Alteromonas sp. MTD1 TaxID=3057962 RepID=UPI0036F2E220
MSVHPPNPDSMYTQQVKQLINMVYPQEAGYGSIFEDARHYFSSAPEQEKQIQTLKAQLANATEKESDSKEQLEAKLKKNTALLNSDRNGRLERLQAVINKIVQLCEGDSFDETQLLSAKFLGTLLLLTRGNEGNFAKIHQRYKPIYKAVLTLRLVDKLLRHKTVAHTYLSKYKNTLSRFDDEQEGFTRWKEALATPLITAALLQDVGLHCPDALNILKGENGDLDEFRLLEETQRKSLLKINFHNTLKYLSEGLGTPTYIGNDKAEREAFNAKQKDAHAFLLSVVKDAFISKTGLGELVKIPQIYVSIVLSTKPDYTRLSLPKGYMLIEQLAKKGSLNKQLAQDFIDIVGYFPQGFGVTFIPVNEKGYEKNQFECAIVTGLNPSNPAEPTCKVVTRNQNYISSGAMEVIPKARNLYFQGNRKKLMRMGKERLMEIINQLSSNVSSDAVEDLVPSFWEPHDFFGYKKHQNLWVKKQ